MGEVYRARDMRLGRDVAVKILAPELARDPEALARFEREVRAVAALSHPNIVALYDIGRDGEVAYAVSELLEGGTLRDRIDAGPVPARKAIEYARAVAEAIAGAHSRGIVHRDLKPENVFLTTDGRIKVLDFGIAHVASVAATAADVTIARQVTTGAGMVIGTAGYMSPEQVRGAATDARTDIFAIGVLLCEMLTGRPAFVRDTPADTVSAILTSDPVDLPRVATSAGSAAEQIVRRCLEKQPDERFQSARDLSFALQAFGTGTAVAALAPDPRRADATNRSWSGIAIALAVTAIVGAAGFFGGRSLSPAATPPAPAALFMIPANTAPFEAVSVSPDGRYVAYTGGETDNVTTGGIRLRRMDSQEMTPLSETGAAMSPYIWSPDSRYFGYFVNDALFVRGLPNDEPRQIADFAEHVTGASWGPSGMLLVGTSAGIYRLDLGPGVDLVAAPGKPRLIVPTNVGHEVWRSIPSFLPDGTHFIYTVLRSSDSETTLETRVATLEGRDVGMVLSGATGATYADGCLFFGLNGGLSVQPFDVKHLTLTGERRQLAPVVAQNWRTGDLDAGASENGVVVFRAAEGTQSQFVWVNRAGQRMGTVGTPDTFMNFSVSPDHRRLVTSRRDPKTGVFSLALIDIDRGVTTPITPRDVDDYDDPTWAPDGRHIAYDHGDKLVLRTADGGDERVLVPAEAYPDDFTPDGRYVTFGRQRSGLYEAWALDILTPGAKPICLVPNVTLSDETRFSKNTKWVAYASNQSGSDQVWVVPFPPTGEKWQISTNGGVQPRWSADGNELFYLNPDGQLMTVSMPDGDPRRAGEPRTLFLTGLTPSNALDQFAVVGDRFLMRIPAASQSGPSSPVHVLVNWKSGQR